MAKKKQSKKSKQKDILEIDDLTVIYGLILVMVTIIGALKMGFVGQFLASCCRFLFGTYYGVIYGVFFVYAMSVFITKKKMPVAPRMMVGVGALLLAFILWSAIPQDETMLGMKVLENYLSHTTEHFKENSTILAQGGLFGAFMFSITSMLVARSGTWVVIIGLIVLACVLLIDKSAIIKIRDGFKKFFAMLKPADDKKEKKAKQTTIFDYSQEMIEEPKYINKVNVEPQKKSIFVDLDKNDAVLASEFDDAQVSIRPKLSEEVMLKTQEAKESEKVVENKTIPVFQPGQAYKLPPTSLLENASAKSRSNVNASAAATKGKKLIEILQNFGINATLIATHIGPAVTKFEIKPDSSVKVSKIMNISDNIKMELAARDIRIEAPIPGQSAVGVEIPNVETTMVKMMELMQNIPADKKDRKMMFILGKDLMGRYVYCDLDKMPHILIAGATGSGKSVCMNTIITSFLLRTRPDEVKLLLIDPKKVEFTPYHNIPHLLGPVISDAEEASRALKVVVEMMENRYEIFSKVGVRNIIGYNEKIELEGEEVLKKMPYVVVIIDELADLMMVAGKDVEMSIQRITQLARAAGIHLIVATQRPSTDVITGIIKANIPSRISFSVSSGIDSRTILDSVGAERLLGYGDMLYLSSGAPSATRLQGVYVTDEEVKRVSQFASNQARPYYEDAFIRLEGVDNNEATSFVGAQEDPMFQEVMEYVIEVQKASTSLLQRRFSLGYNRAARMIDLLEEKGIIGPAQGSKPRDVYKRKEEQNYE